MLHELCIHTNDRIQIIIRQRGVNLKYNYCNDKKNKANTVKSVLCDLPNKGNNKITELRTILQRESQNS